MRLLVPGLLVGGSILAILASTVVSYELLTGSQTNAEGQLAMWSVNEDGAAWTVTLAVPGSEVDYLFDSETGKPMSFSTSIEARDFALGYLKGLGYA